MQSVTAHVQQLASAAELLVTRYTTAALSVLLLLGVAAPQSVGDVLGLVPGYTLSNYYLWTFVTAGLLHTSLLLGAINIVAFVAGSPCLERAWGSRPWLLYLLLVDVSVQLLLFASMIALYALTQSELFLFRSVCGFSGINAAIAVALKQRWAEQPILGHPALSSLHGLRYEHLPFVLCSLSALLWLAGWLGAEVVLVVLGTAVSFVYLRFYAVDGDTGEVGDLRADFSFASLFPDVLGVRGSVNLLAAVPFHVLMRSGLFASALKSHAGRTAAAAADSDSDASLLPHLPGDTFRAVDPQAERRRQLAIKAIDDKLRQLAEHSQQQQQQQQQQAAHQQPAIEASLLLSGTELPDDAELERMEREVTAGSAAAESDNESATVASRGQVAINVQQADIETTHNSAAMP